MKVITRNTSFLLLTSLLTAISSVHSFSIDSRLSPMKESSPSSQLSNRPKSNCGPNCRTFSMEQYGRSGNSRTGGRDSTPASSSSSEMLPLRLSGGGGGSESSISSPLSKKKKLIQEMIAEFVGTFIIVQIGCGTVCSAVFKSAQVGLWQIAAVWSIAVTLAISATASISGAHLNPAITLALATSRGFSWGKVVPFIIAQVAGAVAAAGINFALFFDSIAKFEAANNIIRGTAASVQSASAFGEYWSVSSWAGAFFAEAYGTAFLAFMIFALTNPKNETTSKSPHLIPPLIGATVGGLISVIAPLTQAGFNPARDFGPRIVSWLAGWGSVAMQGWWVYVLAPIVGAIIGGKLADKILFQ